MAFDGTLLTVGNYAITGDIYINAKSYKVTRNTQDLDSYNDANGYLHRFVLPHNPVKIEFQTRPDMTNEEWNDFWGPIASQFPDGRTSTERKVSVTAYVPELDDYVTEDMYIPDPEMTINHITDNVIFYDAVRIAFIGY